MVDLESFDRSKWLEEFLGKCSSRAQYHFTESRSWQMSKGGI